MMQQPKAPGNVLVVYFMLGAGCLIMWNAMLTAFDYFQMEFSAAYPSLQFDKLICVVYNPCTLISLIVLICIQHGFSSSSLVRVGLWGYVALLGVILAIVR